MIADPIFDETIRELIGAFGQKGVSGKELEALLRRNSKRLEDPSKRISKSGLLSFYLAQKASRTELWDEWAIDGATDDALVKLLRAKPRRTASGVATVTVLMKPWPCAGDCACCPNDIRMPKSYLSDEPACQRAERCWFDPYLQVAARMRVLEDMGHHTDKVELIVLGGTFDDYPETYRIWFIEQLFECLNDLGTRAGESTCTERFRFYEEAGLLRDGDELAAQTRNMQRVVDTGTLSYNEAVSTRNSSVAVQRAARMQVCDIEELHYQQRINETAAHRIVGLCVETRPELVTPASLAFMRELGCTKLQIGVQSLDEDVLASMGRVNRVPDIERAFELMRLFGFKSHVHMMANLPGATPDTDKADYGKLVSDERFRPDEVKLYPCALVASAHLTGSFEEGDWAPYDEGTLIDVLAYDLLQTPCHTRVSRMIRDISSKDIIAGNKKTNLRQMVEAEVTRRIESQRAADDGEHGLQEMRFREISTTDASTADLHLEEYAYATSNTDEVFLQYVDEEGRLAAFCRLSLPHEDAVECLRIEVPDAPICANEAMIREVHVYGRVSKLHESKEGAQHLGLGRSLVERACEIAVERGYTSIAVISAVGTRDYYRRLGFIDSDLYQRQDVTKGQA